MKRIISIFLALILVLQLMPLTVFAESEPVKPFKYVALGDSITAGVSYNAKEPDFGNPYAYGQATGYFAPDRCYAPLFAGKIAELFTGDRKNVAEYSEWYYSKLPAIDPENEKTFYYVFEQTNPITDIKDVKEGEIYRINVDMLHTVRKDGSIKNTVAYCGDEPSSIYIVKNGFAAYVGGEYIKVNLDGSINPKAPFYATIAKDSNGKVLRDEEGNLKLKFSFDKPIDRAVEYVNAGVAGLTVKDVYTMLFDIAKGPSFYSDSSVGNFYGYSDLINKELETADLITVLLGYNDLIGFGTDKINNIFGISIDDTLNEVAGRLGGIDFSSKEGFTASVENIISQLAKVKNEFGATIDDILKDYDDLAYGLKNDERFSNADIAILGLFEPFGNSIEFNSTRYNIVDIFFALLSSLGKVGDIKETFMQKLAETDAFDINNIDLSEIIILDINMEKVLELTPVLSNMFDFVSDELMYALSYYLITGLIQPMIDELNLGIGKIAKKYGFAFVYTADEVENSPMSFDPHPGTQGHFDIANALSKSLISKIEYDSNVESAKKALNSEANPTKALYGQEISLKMPSKVSYVSINGTHYDPASVISYKVNSPRTIVYAGYNQANLKLFEESEITIIGDSFSTGLTAYPTYMELMFNENVNDLTGATMNSAKLLTILGHSNGLLTFVPDASVEGFNPLFNNSDLQTKLTFDFDLNRSKAIVLNMGVDELIMNYINSIVLQTLGPNVDTIIRRNVSINNISEFFAGLLDGNSNRIESTLHLIDFFYSKRYGDIEILEIKKLLNEDIIKHALDDALSAYENNMIQIANEFENKYPEAEIIIMGLYNPFKDFNYDGFTLKKYDLTLIDPCYFGRTLGEVIDDANDFLKNLCVNEKLSGNKWTFIDTSYMDEKGNAFIYPSYSGTKKLASDLSKELGSNEKLPSDLQVAVIGGVKLGLALRNQMLPSTAQRAGKGLASIFSEIFSGSSDTVVTNETAVTTVTE